jgi:AcrR family transcriptional regulator
MAILDAAEHLFALRGFTGASLEDIGAEAGVSRGTPSYFFGSKEGLYRAVLVRVFEERELFLSERFRSAMAKLPPLPTPPDRESLRDALQEAVEGYCAFLEERPAFVHLVQREAIEGAERMDAARLGAPAVNELLTELLRRAATASRPGLDVRQLHLSFVSMLFFPYGHASTLVRSLGYRINDRKFLQQRKLHVVELLLAAIWRE